MISRFKWIACGFAVLLLILAACSPAMPAVPISAVPATAVPSQRKSGVIRINNPTSPSLLDIPYLLALDTLREQGYAIELKQYARFDLVAPAMAKGELDIASSALQTMWAAIAKGAPVHTIASRFRNPYRLMAETGIATCAGLTGKNLGIPSTGGATNLMLKQNFLKNCPAAQPTYVVIPATSNRLPALLGGQLNAAFLEVDDTIELEHRAPGKFHMLVNFAEEQPDLEISGVFVRDQFAAEHPEAVHDFVLALLNSLRAVQSKAVLEQAIIKQFGTANDTARTAAAVYLKLGMWDVNGGINARRAEHTLAFMKESQLVPQESTVGQYVDLSFLNAALQALGTR